MTSQETWQALAQFGSLDSALSFAEETPSNIRYLDILQGRDNLSLVEGVLEINCYPVIYVVSAACLTENPGDRAVQINQLKNHLAARGDATMMAVVSRGRLDMYPLTLDATLPESISLKPADNHAKTFLDDALYDGLEKSVQHRLPVSRPKAQEDRATVEAVLRDLLLEKIRVLSSIKGLENRIEDVISLVGRVLFTRFILARTLVTPQSFPELFTRGDSKGTFANAEAATLTCEWLDETFGEHLFPLPEADPARFFSKLERETGPKVFAHLAEMLSPFTGDITQDNSWSNIDFRYLPAGLLTQVYEEVIQSYVNTQGSAPLGVVATAPRIAEFMIEETFHKLESEQPRVLDPSCGSGTFLMLAMRKLLEMRWEKTGKRPVTSEIREVLNNQIRGMDISPIGLRLASLGLALVAIELDAEKDPTELKFGPLLGKVLLDVGRVDTYGNRFGSLNPANTHQLDGKVDIVIGQPPLVGEGAKGNAAFKQHINPTVQTLIDQRLKLVTEEDPETYDNPDNVLDIPFAWMASTWAKPRGIICMVMHARVLYKRTRKAMAARKALFDHLNVTAVINGTEMANAWPAMTQPYCMLIARNEPPKAKHLFYFTTPVTNRYQSRTGQFRIDYDHEYVLSTEGMNRQPHHLKTLSIGTQMDLDLVRKIGNGTHTYPFTTRMEYVFKVRLGDYWQHALDLRQGHGKSAENSESLVIGASHRNSHFAVSANTPSDWVLTGFAPGADRFQQARTLLANGDIAYSSSYYGFSTAGHPDAEALAEYLFVLLNSDVYLYYQLMTSSRFGVDQTSLLPEDIRYFPIEPWEALKPETKAEIHTVADLIREDEQNEANWETLNDWVNEHYKLSEHDTERVRDTLATRLPFQAVKDLSLERADQEMREAFATAIVDKLKPFFNVTNEVLLATVSDNSTQAWGLIDVMTDAAPKAEMDLSAVFGAIAEQHGANRVFVDRGHNHLTLCLLNERRYWTVSQAREIAMEILREYGYIFNSKYPKRAFEI